MGKRAAVVGLATLLVLVATTVWVPVRQWQRLDPTHPQFPRRSEHARAHAATLASRGAVERDHLAARRAIAEGRWASTEPVWPPRFQWVWDRVELRMIGREHQDRIVWPILLTEQTLVLLLAGALMTVLTRQDRRPRDAAQG